MGYQYQPKNDQTLGQSLKIQELMISGVDHNLYTITSPSNPGPGLGEAEHFAVLGSTTVTNTGASVVTGDVGVSPGTSITGFPPGVASGIIDSDGPDSIQAQADALTAYNALVAKTPTQVLTGINLGGLTLHAGVYFFSSSAQLTGTLTLDAQGNPNALFVFQIGSTLTTASASSVVLINGALPGNVYWQVGSSATLGTGTLFKGDIIADVSITANTGANVQGRLLALTGAVTLADNVVNAPNSGTLGSLIAFIREPVVRVYVARVKVDLTNTWTEFNSLDYTIVDAGTLTVAPPSDMGAIQIVGLSALANNDVLQLYYSTTGGSFDQRNINP